jgi:iron-sulfur cluster assembly accessory protein
MTTEMTITDRAALRIRALLAGMRDRGLRVKVVEGGCSGFEYKMAIDTVGAEDRVFERDGARVLLDPRSMAHLSGTTLDYKSEVMQSGFVFNNPNVKATCGCGTSFSA